MFEGRTVATIVLASNTTCEYESPIPASSPGPSFYDFQVTAEKRSRKGYLGLLGTRVVQISASMKSYAPWPGRDWSCGSL